MYSRRRGTGRSQVVEKRRTMCARTWVPSPSRNRPRDIRARSQAVIAVIIGDLGKATAIAVPSSSSGSADAARASGRKGRAGSRR